MQTQFWLDKWENGSIGFHQDAPLPLLLKHWPNMDVARDSRVLVPLCGKSLDMPWLAERGHQVLGVELSARAIEQFFSEHELTPERRESPMGVHFTAGNIELIQGDILDLDDATLAACDAVYDRAAIVALPRDMRQRYVRDVYGRLPAHCRTLVMTLEYAQEDMDGPPFSVDSEQLQQMFEPGWRMERLDRRDILASEPGFQRRGLTSLHTGAYKLTGRNA